MATARLYRKDFLKCIGVAAATLAARPAAKAAERLDAHSGNASAPAGTYTGSIKARPEPRAVARRSLSA